MTRQPLPAGNKSSISVGIFVISLTLLALSLLISAQTYINDDAVISYRYAWHLVNGHGSVTWIGGPREEGFSNPLLVILSALGAGAFGAKSLKAVITVGFIWNYLATAAMLFMLSFNFVSRNRSMANWLSALLLASSYPLSWYLHSGLETPLYTFFLTATVFAVLADKPTLTIPVSIGLAITRTEGVFLALIVWGTYIFQALLISNRRKRTNLNELKKPVGTQVIEHHDVKRIMKSFSVFIAIYLLFTLSRYLYFGHILPNPVYLKSPLHKTGKTVIHGVDYLLLNFKSHPSLVLLVVLCLIEMLRSKTIFGYLPCLAVISAQTCFILAVGGDEFHLGTFRFILPVFPLLIWGAMLFISRIESSRRIVEVFLFIFLLSISYYNALSNTWSFRSSDFYRKFRSEPVRTLATCWKRWTHPSIWIDSEAGKLMAELTLNQGRGLSMASVQAGSLPVHWQGEFIDLLGLTTRKMAIAGDNQSRNEVFKANPPDIVMAFKWAGGWFPVPTARTMIDLGYRPFMVVQLKETLENGLHKTEFPVNFLVLARDLRIFKNLASVTFDGQTSVTFEDDTGILVNEALLKTISINRGIPGD
ncbi:MAG: hypothetical protein WBM02_03200 [bacterium]